VRNRKSPGRKITRAGGASTAASRSIRARVAAVARNLWWTWNHDAQRLFAALDPALWEASSHNPIHTLARLTPARLAALEADAAFLTLLATCEAGLADYTSAGTWFERTARGAARKTLVAYFCAEFALHECVQQYAGGLGVLAGDHLKSASDLGVPLVGVGLLYRCGYYRQSFAPDGATRVAYPQYDFSELPIEDTRRTVSVPIARRKVVAKIWRAQIGRTPLYLLDTDIPANKPADRRITRQLYGGDQHTRIQQEIILGVGGVLALEGLKLPVTVFHLNEGHAAFSALERLRALRKAGVGYDQAVETVRRSTVFTTHTPVPAGHDRFPTRVLARYLGAQMDVISAPGDRVGWLGLGREDPSDRREEFCMTVLALRLSDRRNGVSKLHGQVSREMWRRLFGKRDATRVPIGHVTNGVHSQTWLAPEMAPLYDKYLKPRWVGAGPADDWWRRAARIPPAELWAARRLLRRNLVRFARQRLIAQAQRRSASLAELIAAEQALDENALTIGFARRFATYKRAPLIFRDRKRLAAILNHATQPVQLIFAGKAHPKDEGGQAFAQQVYRHARGAGFAGRVAVIEDYDVQVGRMLTSGCDVWLNNPVRPLEACGTSGMKPPLHGGLNCSILDGWWPEAYDGANGWAIGGRQFSVGAAQDRFDANAIYELLEREIVPLFYERDRAGTPRKWARVMARSMATVCAAFSSHRMVADYVRGYYLPGGRAGRTAPGRDDT